MTAFSIPRRRLLQAMTAAVAMPSLAQSPAPRRLLVLVYLYGGNDSYNTWVPYTEGLYYKIRPNIAVARDAVIKLTDRHGFHPSLASLVPSWEAKELAIVQGVGYAGGTQQHYRDEETAFTGCDGADYSTDGWVSRALASRARGDAADAIAFDVLDIREADAMGPFRGNRVAAVQIYYAQDLLNSRKLSAHVHDANALGRKVLARDTGVLPAVALRTNFPGDPFGAAMRAAVELAKLDPALPVIHVALNGLDGDKHHSVDNHEGQLDYHGDALKRLAEGLASLRRGLQEIGRWDDTLVATYDEFGRSPMENDLRGTHHGLASTHFLMGGRVKGGLYGEPLPVVRLYPIGGPAPVIDTRRVWTTVAQRWWGMDASSLFPRRFDALDLLRA